MPGMICPVVAYAPTAATKPSIAAHPLNLSASGVILPHSEEKFASKGIGQEGRDDAKHC